MSTLVGVASTPPQPLYGRRLRRFLLNVRAISARIKLPKKLIAGSLGEVKYSEMFQTVFKMLLYYEQVFSN